MADKEVKEFDLGKWKEMIDKLGNNSFNFRNGLPTLNGNEVDPEWSQHLSDEWLFSIGGVSIFFSSLAFRAQYHWTWAIPTAGAWVHGGKLHVAFNPYFMMEVLPERGQRVFVVMHEIMHLIHDHTVRCKEQSLDPQLWNIACDYYINMQLHKLAKSLPDMKKNLMKTVPEEVFPLCLDAKYDGWTEIEIYRDLEKQQKQKKDSGEEGGEGNGESGEGQGNNGRKALDDFSDYGGDDGGDNDAGSARNTIYKAIREAEAAAKNGGRQPGSFEADLINSIVASTVVKVDWKDTLGDYVVQNSDELITYNKVSRRNTANIIFPVRTGDSIRLFFGIDTSGSMSQPELEDAAGGVRQVAELFSNHHITLASADTKAHFIGAVDTLEGIEDFDTKNVEIRGGGGTRMSPLLEMAYEISEEQGQEFDAIIVFTDGELMDGDVDDVNTGEIPVIILVTEQGTIPNINSADKIIQLN